MKATHKESNTNNSKEHSSEFLEWKRLHLSKAKLSSITEVATLMAGFAVVATVELQINDDANPYLLSAFTVTTALLVCTTMMALMISTCVLPYVQAVAKLGASEASPKESPHEEMAWFIDASWVLANMVSIFLFTLDVILLCWIKFTFFSVTASICATMVMIPVLLLILVFGVLFYRNLIKHQYLLLNEKCAKLDELHRQISASSVHIV